MCPFETASLQYGLQSCPYLSCSGSGFWNGTNTASPVNPSRCLLCGETFVVATSTISPDATPDAWFCQRQQVTQEVNFIDVFSVAYASNISYNVTTRTFVDLGLYSTGYDCCCLGDRVVPHGC